MKCFVCQSEYEEKCFFMGSQACYKCVYKKKIEEINNKKHQMCLEKKCRVCEKKLPHNKWVYCSYECAATGKKNYQKEFWQKAMKNPMPVVQFSYGHQNNKFRKQVLNVA